MKIRLEGFSGVAPKLDDRILAGNIAQAALDCRLDRDRLESLRGFEATAAGFTVAGTEKTLYHYDDTTWLAFAEVREIVPSPVEMDANGRIYMTVEGSYPRVRDSLGGEYRLGLPRPNPPVATAATPVDNQDPDSVLVAEAVYYRTAFVDDYGAEGPASLPSLRVDREIDTQVTVTMPAQPAGNYNFGANSKVRLYRSNQGTTDAAFQFVADIPLGSVTYTDTIPNAELQEVLPSAEWIGPPDDNTSLYPDGPLECLTDMGNGILAGFSGRTICFSEPYLPHAWPIRYRRTVADNPVALVKIQQGLLVLTDGKPVLMIGTTPDAILEQEIDAAYPCVSKGSVADMGSYAIYATDEGLAIAQGNTVELATRELLDIEHWNTSGAADWRAINWEGKYLLFTMPGGWVFDPRGGARALVPITGAYDSVALYRNGEDGVVTALIDPTVGSGANTLWVWDSLSAGPRSYTWESREYSLARPERFTAWYLDAPTFPVTIKIYKAGVLWHTITATKREGRLPNGKLEDFSIEFSGTNPVNAFEMATSRREIVGG